MKRKFKRDSDLEAQLGQAFNRYSEGIFKLNTKLVKELDTIAALYDKDIVIGIEKISDAHYELLQAWYKSTLIA